MHSVQAFVVVLAMLGSSLGCSKSAPPPGKATSVADVCNEADKGRVRLDGYLRYPRGLLSFCSTYGGHQTCDLELYEKAERPAAFDIMHSRTGPEPVTARLSVPVGDRPGEMDDLPKKFQDSDIKLHLPQGVATEGAHIIVDGTLSVIPSDPKRPSVPKSCFVTVEWATAG